MSDFVHLHAHDHYSLLDGLNTPEEMVLAAKALGHNALAQTNHATLSGHRDLQIAAKKHGIKPILGSEVNISPTDRFDRRAIAKRDDNTENYNHLILLATGQEGLVNLQQLSEKSWTEGFYSKARIDRELLLEHRDGLIVLSGCRGGLIAKALERGDQEAAERITRWFKTNFEDNFFIEIQTHNPIEMNYGLLALADKYNIKPVVTSDAHYALEKDKKFEEAMLIISANPKPNKDADFEKSRQMEDTFERFDYLYPDRRMRFTDLELFLASRDQLAAGLAKQEITRTDVFESTLEIADAIGDYEFHEGLDLLPDVFSGNAEQVLRDKVAEGLKWRGLDKDQEAIDRCNEEIAIHVMKNFVTYILIVQDLVSWARSQDIKVGPGRGSGAGSMVNYVLGITNINPLERKLLFFRFVNPERDEMPDIDVDFEDTRRIEVKRYAERKYGVGNVASIITFNKFQGKNSLKDAARVYRVPLNEVTKASKGIDTPPDRPEKFFEALRNSEHGSEFCKKYPEVLELATYLQGRIRGSGMHAAGIVLSNKPLSQIGPIQTVSDPNDKSAPRLPLIAYDMETAADVGLIKIDALGLKALTIIHDTQKLIKERTGRWVDENKIPLDDKNVYDMLSAGHTKGVFQSEAVPSTSLIIKMGGVNNFDELAVSNALVRPGAANTIGAEYIARKNGAKTVTYEHPIMKDITADTFGCILYQEQVMLTMTNLAGMKMATADKVRKIIGKKKDVSEFEAYREEFIMGAQKNVSAEIAAKLWHDFEAHADYSFNKSHTDAYSTVSYWMAWLKYYYPLEFMTSVLKNERGSDKDTKMSITEYLIEAKRLGITIKLPHVNSSNVEFSIEGDAIRFGLANIKFLSEKTAVKLIAQRPFANYTELSEKALEKGSGISTRVLGSLNAVGAAYFPDNPRRGDEKYSFYEYLNIPAFNYGDIPATIKEQLTPLDEYDEKGSFIIMGMVAAIKKGPGWARVEIVSEAGTAGIFTDENTPIEAGQTYAMLVANNRIARYVPAMDLSNKINHPLVNYLYSDEFEDLEEPFYRVISFQVRETKAGKKMANAVFADREKNLTAAVVFPKEFHKAYSACIEGATAGVEFGTTGDGALYLKDAYK